MTKTNWRAKLWKTVKKAGDVVLPDAIKPDHWQDLDLKDIFATSATEGMERDAKKIKLKHLKSSMSAAGIIKSGFMHTGWTASPQEAVAQPSLLSVESLPLEVLEESKRELLYHTAEEIGCTVQEYVQQILEFYIENEADILETGTVFDTVNFYLDNELIRS